LPSKIILLKLKKSFVVAEKTGAVNVDDVVPAEAKVESLTNPALTPLNSDAVTLPMMLTVLVGFVIVTVTFSL
jgi:hypothetical protein